jgi:macrolide-specific efflux system membrane fusion protein
MAKEETETIKPVKTIKSVNPVKRSWNWLRSDKKRLIGSVIVLIILIFGIWKIVSGKSNAVKYQTAVVTKGTVVSTISASGLALSTSVLPINTQSSGIVKTVYVKDGDKVVKGQKIADLTLDTSGEQQNSSALSSYYGAQSALVSANNAYYTMQSSEYVANQKFMNDAVARTLATDDPTYIEEDDAWLAAQASFLNQQTTLAQANIALNNASINLQLSSPTITAPYTGTIDDINLVPGMVITNTSSTNSSGSSTVSSQRVAVITNDATPIVNVTLGETDVPNVKIGQKATVTFDSIANETFTGTVATVDRIGTISSNVTSYGVNIKLDSGSNLILPNMAATANIIVDTATDALYVPSTALVTQSGTTYAKTLVSGREVDVAVETGISDDTNTVITSGLTEGQTVITGTVTSTTTAASTGTSVFSSSLRGVTGGGGAAAVRGGGAAATFGR